MVFFFLCIISVVEVFSASSHLTYATSNYWKPMIKHVGILALGLFFMIVTLNIKCKYFKLLTFLLVGLSYIMLIAVFFVGTTANDANRWINVFGISLQPAEVAKGAMVLVTAVILSSTQTENGADKRALWWIAGICLPMLFLIGMENLSTAILITGTLFFMMFIGRVPAKQMWALIGIGASIVTLALIFVLTVGKVNDSEIPIVEEEIELVEVDVAEQAPPKKSGFAKITHRAVTWRNRILSHADKERVDPAKVDVTGNDAQTVFSHIAIASSHGIGVGPGNSELRDWLPHAYDDFIFAIILEELGLFGGAFVAMLYIILLIRVRKIAHSCENNFPALLAMGLALLISIQAVFNMCVAVGLAPVTGQPLPLISKGGTSTVINCIYIGVILSISRSAKKRETLEEMSDEEAQDILPDDDSKIILEAD